MNQEKDPQSWKVITKKVRRDIRVQAREDELLACGQKAAKLASQQTSLEEAKKAEADRLKAEIDDVKGQLNAALEEIRSQKISIRNADCVEEYDTNSAKYRLWWGTRLVEERPMEVEERKKYEGNIFNIKPSTEPAPTPKTPEETATEEDIRQVIREEKNTKTKKAHV